VHVLLEGVGLRADLLAELETAGVITVITPAGRKSRNETTGEATVFDTAANDQIDRVRSKTELKLRSKTETR
jgi:hypothetical protein